MFSFINAWRSCKWTGLRECWIHCSVFSNVYPWSHERSIAGCRIAKLAVGLQFLWFVAYSTERQTGNDDLSLPKGISRSFPAHYGSMTMFTTATVQKIITEILSPSSGHSFARDARDLLIECCVEFITLISSEANEISEKEAKKTIAVEHIEKALTDLGFQDYVPDVLAVADEFKDQQKVHSCPFANVFSGHTDRTVHRLERRSRTRWRRAVWARKSYCGCKKKCFLKREKSIILRQMRHRAGSFATQDRVWESGGLGDWAISSDTTAAITEELHLTWDRLRGIVILACAFSYPHPSFPLEAEPDTSYTERGLPNDFRKSTLL